MDGFHDLEVWEGGKRALKPLLAFNGGEGEFEREGRWKGVLRSPKQISFCFPSVYAIFSA